MKTRAGFVSNSSSSSFVVAFPKIPHNVQELHDILFKDFHNEHPEFTTQQYAETIFGDMYDQVPMKKSEIIKEVCSGYSIEMDDFEHEWRGKLELNEFWEKYDEEQSKRATEYVKKWLKENPDAFFYKFSYADENGSYGSTLEHGGMFDSIPNIRISHH